MTVDGELLALLTLRLTPQLGPRRIELLRRQFSSAQAVLEAPLIELRRVPGLDQKSLSSLGDPQIAGLAQQEYQRCQERGVTLLGRGLPGYPAALESLHDPPAVLWVLGMLPDLPAVPRSLGIVGTRSASSYGLSLTRQISAELARAEVTVISGLARGIDTAAHQAAVEAGGLSIAVLGNAVDQLYPRENAALARSLTLISEYPLGTGPAQHHFPTRNRLIAALSAGVLVIEGELKSGSLITATHALECGRTVFALPGRAGEARSAGPHRLIREGAVLTETAADVLQELNWTAAAPLPAPELPAEQSRLWTCLSTPRTLDDLHLESRLPLPELQTALVLLQLRGLVEEQGGRWQRR